MYVVMMAGGGGTRLWPLSRPERPKPFMPLLGDETLLQATVRRLAGIGGDGVPIDVTVVTDQRYEQLVRAQLPDVRVLIEPAGRNTAAAIALATVAVDRPDDDVMIVLPADHFIRDEGVFRDVAADGREPARDGRARRGRRAGHARHPASRGRRPSTAT